MIISRNAVKLWLAISVLGLAAIMGAAASYAQNDTPPTPVILTDGADQFALGGYLELFEDPTGQLTIAQVSAPDFAARFAPSPPNAPGFGYTNSAVWVRLRLNNQTTATGNWILEIQQARMSQVDLYRPIPNGAGFDHAQIGFTQPFANREIPHHKLLFPVPLPPQAEQTLYLRFQSQTRVSLPLTLWTAAGFARFDHVSQFLWGIYYGILLIMAGYNLFLFVALRERSYLYLVLFISAVLTNVTFNTGRAQEYLWFNLGQLNNWLVLLAGMLTVVFLLKFTSSFLETKSRAPRLHRLITLLVIALPALQLAALPFCFQAAVTALLLPTIAALVTVAWASVAIWRQGFHPARYFVLAELVPLLLGIFEILGLFGLLPEVAVFRQMTYVGNVLLVLFMSLALADRINLLKAETEAANLRLKDNERRLNQFLDAVPVGLAIQDHQGKGYYVNKKARELFNLQRFYSEPDGEKPPELWKQFPVFRAGTDDPYPLDSQPLRQALQGQTVTVDDLEVMINNERVRLEVWSSPIYDQWQQLVYAISAFNDITERKHEEAELAQYRQQLAELVEARTIELRQANQSLNEQRALAESMSEIAAALNRNLESDTVLAEALAQLKHVVAYRRAAVWLLEGKVWALTKTDDLTEAEAGQWLNLPASHSLTPLFSYTLSDATTQSRLITWLDQETGQYWLGMPLAAGEQIIGVLLLQSQSTPFTPNELKALHTFADYVAVAVVNARLYEQAHVTATTRERERLARDLHDAVTQTLFAASIIAETLPGQWKNAPPEAIQNVEKLRQLTRGALAEMRSLLLELRPAALLQARLENLLTQLSEAMTGRTQIPVQLHIETTPGDAPPEVKVTCYRIAQEAFNNIIKHARATEVNVTLSGGFRSLLLQITDNGRGFNPAAVPADHMGLAIMRERTAAIGAKLYIDSRPGQGTELAFLWPAPPEESSNGA